jgi:SpoU rRNA methylase family enzyme
MSTVFPPHPHIYEFIRRLKDEHEYQHHKSEEAQVQVKKCKSIYEKIDEKLLQLINNENGKLTPTELAINSDQTVKIKKANNKVSHVDIIFHHICSLFFSSVFV